MPEYHIDTSLDQDRWNRLDAFTKGYIEAAYWTECNSDNEELENATFADLSQTALVDIIAECEAFQKDNVAALAQYYEAGRDEAHAGHDFWLTRNRHGAGFWDRGMGAVGITLTNAAHAYGEANLYMGDDEMVHCD